LFSVDFTLYICHHNSMIKFEMPKVTVDVVIFTTHNGKLQTLLIRRKNPPFKGLWALPGGFLEKGEKIIRAAGRELFEEAGVGNIYMEQLYTFGDPGRDPRGRVITVAYFVLVPAPLRASAGSDAREVKWWPVRNMPKLAFDHKKIISYAHERLKLKLEYTNVAWSLLTPKFTLSELQSVYETVWGKSVDKRNFRKKILSLKLLKASNEMRSGLHQRPARLYSFKSRKKEGLKKFF